MQTLFGAVVAAGALFIVGCNADAESGTNAEMIEKQQKGLPPVDPNVIPQAPQREDGGGMPGKGGNMPGKGGNMPAKGGNMPAKGGDMPTKGGG